MAEKEFISLSFELEESGLVWHPEIGDEVCSREPDPNQVSILVNPSGMTPSELRQNFVWLPTVEQLVVQIEVREAMLYHAGISEKFTYETVIKTPHGFIEAAARSLRIAIGKALNGLLSNSPNGVIH